MHRCSFFFWLSLFVQVLFEAMVKEMKAGVDVFWLKGASHGLTVKGRTEDSVMNEVNLQVLTWLGKQNV